MGFFHLYPKEVAFVKGIFGCIGRIVYFCRKTKEPMNRILLILMGMMAALPMMGQRHRVVLETTEGTIKVVLYDDTPRHRDNFLKLVNEHFYDSLLFHRVIKGFMIQAGDPTSRHAEPGQTVGEGDVGYTLEPEFFDYDDDQQVSQTSEGQPQRPTTQASGSRPRLLHYHRRGVLAMAREGDEVNPGRRSSGCQFYIVWGKTFSSKDLQSMQERLDTMTNHQVIITPEMFQTYKRIGGTPHLDGQYTVFGEVIEGMDVVERIQNVFTDDYDRPVDDVRILQARTEE